MNTTGLIEGYRPLSKESFNALFISIISCSFMVMSSSVLPPVSRSNLTILALDVCQDHSIHTSSSYRYYIG